MATHTTKRKKKDNTVSQVVGTGVGGAGGAAAGAAIGSAVLPGVGTAVGALIGGVAGAVTGNIAAEYVDPAEEERYWEKNYSSRPYYEEGVTFNEYQPAYRYGVESATRHPDENFDAVEKRLSRNWSRYRGEDSTLGWAKARDAVRDAYDRTLKLHEERLNVDKKSVTAGEVTLRKEVVRDRQKIDVPVEREEVVVNRRKVHRPASPADIRPQSEEVRIPVKRDKVKVTKETFVTEEVDVSRRKTHGVEHVEDTVRKEQLRVQEKGDVKVRTDRATRR